MDGFGLTEPGPGQRRLSGARRPCSISCFAECAHTELSASPVWTWVCPPARWATARSVTPTSAAAGWCFRICPGSANAIDDGAFFENPAYNKAMDDCLARRNTALHLCGLLSDGGVHSHIRHLFALLRMAKQQGADAGLYPRLSRRARRLPLLRQGLSSPSAPRSAKSSASAKSRP